MQVHGIPLASSPAPQRDSDPRTGAIDGSNPTAPLQADRQESAPNTDSENEDDLQLDKLFLLMGRLNASPLNSQRAAVPELVSQGVIPMGWRVRRSTPKDPAELQFFDRLERAETRRLANQCSRAPSALQPKVTSPIVFYLESVRQAEAMQCGINDAQPPQPTPVLEKRVRSSSTTALTDVKSEPSDGAPILAGPLTTSRLGPKRSLPQLVPSMFSSRRKSSGRPKTSGSSQAQDKPAKSTIRRLFSKHS